MAKRKFVSMRPKDAATGGAFQGGRTTIKKARFGRGYINAEGETTNESVYTMRLTHLPKGESQTRTEMLSCGNSASKNFTISKDGKYLISRVEGSTTSIHASSNAMLFLDSCVEAGFPDRRLETVGITALEGLVFIAEQRPVKREGLTIEGDTPATALFCKKIVKLPGKAEASDEDDEDEGGEDEETDDENDEDDESEDDSEGEESDEDDEGSDDENDESEDDDEGGGDDDEDEVSDSVVDKELKKLIAKAGGSIKVATLGTTAFKALRTHEHRNAIATRIVEGGYLKRQKGWKYNPKAGTVSATR